MAPRSSKAAGATGDPAGGGPRVQFTTTLLLEGKTATGIVVPDELVEQLGHGKKPPVQVTIGAHTYPSTVAVMGGRFLVPVSAANREAAGVAAGDTIEVVLVLDTAPRTVEIPADLAAALDPAARAFLDGLSPSQQKWHVTQIEGAKTDETRQRRVARSVELLRAGQAR